MNQPCTVSTRVRYFSGLTEPEATCVMAGASSGPRAATAITAPTTRSTGITSIDALGDAGELLQQAAGVGDDHRLGHAEAPDPAGAGLGQRRLDDRRPHDRHRHGAPVLHERLLAQGLGVGVGVGPAEADGAGPAGLDHAVGHPALAELLGLGRPAPACRRRPARRRAPLRNVASMAGDAALVLGVGAGPAGGGHLAPPVDAEVERAVGHQRLGRRAPAVAGHVAGRHGHQVGGHAERRSGWRRCGTGRAG